MEPEKFQPSPEPNEQDQPLTPQEAEKRYRLELFKFVSVIFVITSLALTNMYFRQQPLIEHREYDYQSSFVFRNIYQEGELVLKACFKKELYGGYFVCHHFPPTKKKNLESGDYSPEAFGNLFVDPEYMEKFLSRFQEKEAQTKRQFLGFRIKNTPEDLIIQPYYDEPALQQLDPELAIQLQR